MTTMADLPPDVSVTRLGQRVSVLLPPRRLGALRWLAIVPLGFLLPFGAIFGMVAAVVLYPMLLHLFGNQGMGARGGAIAITGAVAIAVFLLVLRGTLKLLVICIGVLLGQSRTEILLTEDEVRDVEHGGPLHVTVLRRQRASVQTLRVAPAGIMRDGQRFSSIHLLPAPDPKQKDLAPAYPRDLLTAVANYVAAEWSLETAEEILHDARPPQAPTVEIGTQPAIADTDPTAPFGERALPAQRATSRIQAVLTPDMQTFDLPHTGFHGLAGFLLWFGLAWCLVTVTISVAVAVNVVREHDPTMVLPIALTVLFVTVGVAMLAGAIQVGFRRAVVLATRESLVITQTGPLRRAEFQWDSAQLRAIRVGPSGTAINDQPVLELQVHIADGTKRGFFLGRAVPELHWLAATLSAFYGR